MIKIPSNEFEQYLTDWIGDQLRNGNLEEDDKRALNLLLRISKAQMVQRHRGDDYPFIEELRLTTEEYEIIECNHWTESENIEVRAYCLDLCARQKKDKRAIKRAVSDAYLELYKKVHTPWYLVRSVVVRYFQKGKDGAYLQEVIKICPHIHGSWLKYISEKLAKDYKESLDGYASTLEAMITAAEDKHSWHDAMEVLDALYVLKRMPSEQYLLRRALLYEEEFDYKIDTQTETTYNMKLDSIQKAHKEISKIKDKYPDLYNKIRAKMIEEQKVFAEKMQIFGAKSSSTIPQDLVNWVDEWLKKAPISSAVELITTIRTIPFINPANVRDLRKALVQSSPLLYMSFGNSVAIGDKGQTLGKADTETSLKIAAHKRLRGRIQYITKRLLIDYLKRELPLDEEAFGQGICDACKASCIEDSRKVLWAKGIFEGCKGDIITASHILVPQMERALVVKAEHYCGDLTNYEREHHDQISLERALTSLKPYLKGTMYDELSFFLNNGADVNFRNRIAHGLMAPSIIVEEGIYMWWLAIKMVFCEKEIFK